MSSGTSTGLQRNFHAITTNTSILADPSRFVGRAPQQVDEFLSENVAPWLERRNAVDLEEVRV